MRRAQAGCWAVLVATITLAACSPKPLQSGPKVRIAIGGQSQLVYLPTTLAERLGYYRDEGLEVELADFQGGAKSLEALFGGSTDVVSGFFDHTVQMAAEGRQLKAFVLMIRYPGLALVVSPVGTRKVDGVGDLAGATVGVSAPGSSTHLFLQHLLHRAGVAVDQVSTVGVGMAAGSVAAMETGKVDAAVMAEPAMSQLASRTGKALRILADTRGLAGVKQVYGTQTYPASVLYSQADWIAKNPEVARRLARAIKRTLVWIDGHSAKEIAMAMPAEFRTDKIDLYVQAIEHSKGMYSPDGVMAEEGARAVVEVMSSTYAKVREARVAAASCYTNEFVGSDRAH